MSIRRQPPPLDRRGTPPPSGAFPGPTLFLCHCILPLPVRGGTGVPDLVLTAPQQTPTMVGAHCNVEQNRGCILGIVCSRTGWCFLIMFSSILVKNNRKIIESRHHMYILIIAMDCLTTGRRELSTVNTELWSCVRELPKCLLPRRKYLNAIACIAKVYYIIKLFLLEGMHAQAAAARTQARVWTS